MRASIKLLRNLGSALAVLGVDPRQVLEQSGLSWQEISEAHGDERIPVASLTRFWAAAAALSQDPSIGVRVGAQARLELFGVLGGAARVSPTLGDALLKTARYVSFWDESVRLSVLIEGGERGQVCYRSAAAEPGHPCEADCILTTLLVLSRELIGQRLVPSEVRLAHPAPRDDSAYRDVFGVAPAFAAAEHSLVFPADALMLPIATHDSAVERALALEVRRLLAELPKTADGMAQAAEAAIEAELEGGNPLLENIAARLGVHPKTLTRRLKQQGTSHSELLDRVRRRLAERYLGQPHMNVTDVAFLLGFSDASAFNKACRRWFGISPLNFRKRSQ